ncbi:MAG: NAD kinase [Chlamydiae bacterium]|nr:NAD kinase [Chlamydiota bacterium]
MMKILLFPKLDSEKNKALAKEVLDFLLGKGVMVIMDDQSAALFDVPPLSSVDTHEINFMVSMGGDGTILRLLHQYQTFDIPVIGINSGHLGFMADIPSTDVKPSLSDLLEGAYEIENRLMLQSHIGDFEGFAINDVAIHRSSNPNLVELAIRVNGNPINTFESDGVIVSTPNGSTAYSLAAGGPILTPQLGAVVLTPISPHTISNRPIVLSADYEIEIEYRSAYDPIEVVLDGISHGQMKTGDVIKIKKHEKKFRMVTLSRHDYFSTLRTKLGWVGKLR